MLTNGTRRCHQACDSLSFFVLGMGWWKRVAELVIVKVGKNWQQHMTLERMLESPVGNKFRISGRIGLFGIQVVCELLR